MTGLQVHDDLRYARAKVRATLLAIGNWSSVDDVALARMLPLKRKVTDLLAVRKKSGPVRGLVIKGRPYRSLSKKGVEL